jgi:hypothetical protein
MRGRVLRLALFPALLATLAGCACRAATVVVAAREERTRLEREFRGVRTDELGRVGEVRRDRLVHEWWVRDTEGRWHLVDEPTYRAAAPGREVGVCR